MREYAKAIVCGGVVANVLSVVCIIYVNILKGLYVYMYK